MSKRSEVVILDCWASPFCMRVKLVLREKGVEYESREEDLFGGKSQLLLSSNPIHKKVPVLLHNKKPILESTNIVAYIDTVWPSPPLLPSSPYEAAQARFWADFIDKKVFEAGTNIWRSTGEAQEVAKKDFIEVLKQLEGSALGDKKFFAGEAFGFVDLLTIPLTNWFLAYEKIGDFKIEDYCPKLSDWIKRCNQRESVAKVLPDPEKVYEFVASIRKSQGIE
ncbi:hypothetical protein FNV43_RR13943 [Rhamnella rubrinervis]|uniref:glutathione transferase n=1 Tax=Rhamnella rubrinervis TaxID=2594499 RepID=A0A8K0H2C5_9ROSA|nr:hypothetical protein FNV43_RR13943 [Rhamnella rubrinervis]